MIIHGSLKIVIDSQPDIPQEPEKSMDAAVRFCLFFKLDGDVPAQAEHVFIEG